MGGSASRVSVSKCSMAAVWPMFKQPQCWRAVANFEVKALVVVAHVKNSCYFGGLTSYEMDFSFGSNKKKHWLLHSSSTLERPWCTMFNLCFQCSFSSLWNVLKSHKPLKAARNHSTGGRADQEPDYYASFWSSEVWAKGKKKKGLHGKKKKANVWVCEHVCTRRWLLNVSLRTLRSKHALLHLRVSPSFQSLQDIRRDKATRVRTTPLKKGQNTISASSSLHISVPLWLSRSLFVGYFHSGFRSHRWDVQLCKSWLI